MISRMLLSATTTNNINNTKHWANDKDNQLNVSLPSPRDLGEQIRKHVTKLVSADANLSSEATAQLNKQLDALERLSENVYAKQYPRRYESTATGLTAAQCSQVLSSEFLQYLNDKPK